MTKNFKPFLLVAFTTLMLNPSLPTWAQTGSTSRAATIVDAIPQAKHIDQAVISPDGTQVAYIVDGELNVIPATGGSAHVISVEGKLSVRDVAWSHDSAQVTFIADLEGEVPAAQVFTAKVDGSTPVKRADLKGYAAAPSFSPDDMRLALRFIQDIPRIAGPLQPMTPLSGEIGEKIYEQRLTTIDLSTNAVAQISPADMYVYEYEWTPDGQGWIGAAAHGSGDSNWYIAKLYHFDGKGEAHQIYSPKWQIADPHLSPDGKNIAFIEGLMSDEGPTGGDVFVVPVDGGTPKNVTPGINSSPSSVEWISSDRILFGQNIDGHSGFASVSSAGEPVQSLWSADEFVGSEPNTSGSFSRDRSSSAVIRESASMPPEIWVGAVGKWKQVTSLNSAVKATWGEVRNFHWTNGSMKLQGWLMLPKDYSQGKTYPLIVNVHGGPSSACTPTFGSKTLSAESEMGYFAFCPNPRGSYGQGESFTRANIKDFGGGDFRDIMTGVDAIAKQFPIDSHRLGIRGHSYGGYMTMWAETQTQRFAAAVAGAGLSDFLSYYGVNEIDEWMTPFFGASIYDDPAVYAKSDPMHFVKAVKTPTLILVGDRDGEVPMEQSVEWWHALRALKVPVKFVVYPNEGHALGRPADARDYLVRTLDWFEEWFGKVPAAH